MKFLLGMQVANRDANSHIPNERRHCMWSNHNKKCTTPAGAHTCKGKNKSKSSSMTTMMTTSTTATTTTTPTP